MVWQDLVAGPSALNKVHHSLILSHREQHPGEVHRVNICQLSVEWLAGWLDE